MRQNTMFPPTKTQKSTLPQKKFNNLNRLAQFNNLNRLAQPKYPTRLVQPKQPNRVARHIQFNCCFRGGLLSPARHTWSSNSWDISDYRNEHKQQKAAVCTFQTVGEPDFYFGAMFADTPDTTCNVRLEPK
ncbi:hypothetical protein CSKR_203214 [Clonorchis sinensis]|uniref:Uncharacterized protein n=1 Tax=Clonorchis sinensis TaxID=79923 RepID=A0A8T1M7M0_CLOSI|nr:hypothetical protein CSKR_203214 [Clonorchis sinensis]